MSSFSGKIKEFPQISIDRFDGRNLASTAYFLSHAHSDHMVGLSSPQFLDHLESNSGVYLYCSPITARFLQASIRHHPLDPFVRPLPLEDTVKITVPNVTEEASHQLWVTLIPAGHCPGSVMFIFEGRGGNVLYTGDFRISVGDAERIKAFHNPDGTVKLLDSLHIDTTFCHKDIIHFPSREESANAIGDLIEDWLAQGNNHLIHLVCPAKYGYEFVYRSIHERFNMRVHVSRWKHGMYATVPDIKDALTTDPTETWIHSCDWRVNLESDEEGVKQLPCRFVPYGVDTDPAVRVIKPTAMFYTFHPSLKEIKQVSSDGTFCRVLLSMHASCSEVLDLVSYLRPRKVYPNVIPANSTREEVLKLLHEALNQEGDHYSIEYGSRNLGSFKRQLQVSDTIESSILDGFLCSPNKRRRHSDSHMTLALPPLRGNMKGSLSLEGETRCDALNKDPNSSVVPDSQNLKWNDPYSQSNSLEFSVNASATGRSTESTVMSSHKEPNNPGTSNVIVKVTPPVMHLQNKTVSEDGDSLSDMHSSQDSAEFSSVFSDDYCSLDECLLSPRISGESSIKRSRKLWYKHKYFSTPVHDEVECSQKSTSKYAMTPRSSSLPLPESENCTSPDIFSNNDLNQSLPLITVSSPSDVASESQVSDETNVTVILSSEEPSDVDILQVDDDSGRPSVICEPPTKVEGANGDCTVPCLDSVVNKTVEKEGLSLCGQPPMIDLVSDSDCTPDLEDILAKVKGNDGDNASVDQDSASNRSSCLKTALRKDSELEVVSLEHP